MTLRRPRARGPNSRRASRAISRAGPVQVASIAPNVRQWHRGLALLAIISLLIGTRDLWTRSVTIQPALTATLSAVYAASLVMGVLALIVRTERAMTRVDLAIMVGAGVRLLATFAIHHRPGDEGALTAQAARSLLAGDHVYGVHWPQVFSEFGVAITKTMDGGGNDTYAYPPLGSLLTAVTFRVLPFLHVGAAATATTTGALLAGAVMLWVLLPNTWRSAGTAVTLGFPMLPAYAGLGYPAILAMALLIPVIARWTRIGEGCRLGRAGVIRAACLGAACAAQQLAWFLVPFLLVGMFALRRSESSPRPALLVVGRFAAIAAGTFLAISAPLIVRDGGGAWMQGILTPIFQHAVPHGQGLIDISYYFTDGSGGLDFYSYATASFGLALLVVCVLFMRRLGAALTVLPWLVFFLAIRSQDGYYLLMTPLWLAAAATAPPSAFAHVWTPGLRRLASPRLRAALVGAISMPSVACLVIAIVAPPPLRMQISAIRTVPTRSDAVSQLVVRVENTSDMSLTPHYAISVDQSMSGYWDQTEGPTTLAPRQTADVTLVAANPRGYRAGSTRFMKLRAVTDTPQTISSVSVDAP